MKKIRIILSTLAIIAAIGGAFASHLLTTINGYEYVAASGGEPAQCIQHLSACSDVVGAACTIGTVTLRGSSNVATSCGTAVFKKP